MAINATLKVRAAGTTLVPDLEAQADGVRRFVGRVHHATHAGGVTAWAPTTEPVTLPYRHEYAAALKAGELEPADADTAKLAGLAWRDGHADARAEIQDTAPTSAGKGSY